MKVVISIHDVCDESIRETGFLLEALERFPKTFLVIPLWKSSVIGRELVGMLQGQDVALHGLTHSSAANDPLGKMLLFSKHSLKEFYGLGKKETTRRITEAKILFENAFGNTPEGFVPPMWHHNQFTKSVLQELGFRYTESANAFFHFPNQEVSLPSVPVCFDFGKNKILNQLSIFSWKLLKYWPQDLVRLSIHPSDIRNGYWPKIERLISWYENRGAQFISNKNLSSTLCYPSLSAL